MVYHFLTSTKYLLVMLTLYILLFLEKSATQGRKRTLESDNDENKSSPPRVSY